VAWPCTLSGVAPKRFEGLLEQHGPGTVVVVPFDLKETFGSGRPPVRATVNGYAFRTTLFRMGGRGLLGLNREVRERAGVEAGETVRVELERDDEPRIIEPPPDLAAALERDAAVRHTFQGLSYTHKKEYVRWIEEAKREETRHRRVEKSIKLLREGMKTPR
jgi:Bacteriocin-protection, YdeI or OmpD-Associated/Domain of unknown function (DUF1905)